MRNVQVIAPTEEPVKVWQLKEHLRLNTDDEDLTLIFYLRSARDTIERLTRRQIMPATWETSVLDFNSPVDLPKPPFIEIASVKYYSSDDDEQYPMSEYTIDSTREPARLHWLDDLPSLSSEIIPPVTIRYTAGYGVGKVPPPLFHAVMLLAASYYQHREAKTDTPLHDLPFGLENIVRSYRVREF